jgi:DNA-binding response OmpR family regulator
MKHSGTVTTGTAAMPIPARLRVALVEDDREFRDEILVPVLTAAGFEVSGFGDAAGLYRAMMSAAFDIVVLDIGLPDENGFEVARHLRETSPVGIVMLTGRNADPDRVRGLTLGADAYLPKPVEPALLIATLHSLARRLRMEPPGGGEPAGWQMDARGWHLVAPDAQRIELTPAERTIVSRLFEADGQPVPRDTLIADLTDDCDSFDPHRLEMLVHRLRRKCAAATPHVLPLRAIRNQGYLLTLDRPAAAGSPSRATPHE